MTDVSRPSTLAWRAAGPGDLNAVMAIQDDVHTMLPERIEVFAAKLDLCPEGCRILMAGSEPVGYGFAHPWVLDSIPPLDTVIGTLPASPDCLFLHDVALRAGVRGRGAGRTYVADMTRLASRIGLSALALVSVYDSFPRWQACGFAPRLLPEMAAKLASYGEQRDIWWPAHRTTLFWIGGAVRRLS